MPAPNAIRLPNVRSLVAAASGKSTVAVNPAAAFAVHGLRTGMLDADLCGPHTLHARTFLEIAHRVWAMIDDRPGTQPNPKSHQPSDETVN